MNAVYTHIPLDRLDMSREQVEDFVAQLNEALDALSEGETTLVAARQDGDIRSTRGRFHRAVITNEGTLAIDARLARRLDLKL